jgi:hypothetical protein
MTLITDNQTLKGATYHSKYPIQTYDDSGGPLWISRNSIGINGIVRAKTWEDAYSICEDEFFPEAEETIADIVKEYGFKREHVKIVNDGTRLRDVTNDDYGPNGLKDGISFVEWQTRETPDADAWADNELFQEAFGFRPNGPNARDKQNPGIYSKDLNGDCLDLLTPKMLEDIGITLDIVESMPEFKPAKRGRPSQQESVDTEPEDMV